jgi:hypothetical protein
MLTATLNGIPRACEMERRRSRRILVSLPVELEFGADKRLGRLTDLSRTGGRVDDLGGAKTLGDTVVLRRNGIEVRAQIVWADRSAVGLLFTEPLEERSFLQIKRLG